MHVTAFNYCLKTDIECVQICKVTSSSPVIREHSEDSSITH